MLILRKNIMCIYLLLFAFLNISSNCKKDDLPVNNSTYEITTELNQIRLPLHTGVDNKNMLNLRINVSTAKEPLELKEIEIVFEDGSNFTGLSSIAVDFCSAIQGSDSNELYGSAKSITTKTMITGMRKFGSGIHFLKFNFNLDTNPDLLTHFQVSGIKLSFKNHDNLTVTPSGKFIFRPVMVLRAQGQDKIDTYRIPGLITTNNGTLIAVYDNRYNNSKDLQEDIDIGMSRSTNGGQTWESMKVIMDMGEYGGRSQRLNGIGDPCVLYDHQSNTIWVAALWMSGASEKDMLWWVSKPGMKPEETGQFVLVKSIDNGLTWSQPINITSQIKNPGWQLLLQGPGKGICTNNGTLVFPAQFKADIGEKALDGGQFTCHSTIVYSTNQGKTWQIGTGAKSNTTEAQVVELNDGSLMLNMRDDRNRKDKSETNGRAVATTTDLGKTWLTHQSSNSKLQEPNCMASLISAELEINGKMQQVLFFSNPDSKTERNNMTIKTSLDGGLTWPVENQILLNSEAGYGYSCMSMIDNKTIGIVYEGLKELYFQKIPVHDLLGNIVKK